MKMFVDFQKKFSYTRQISRRLFYEVVKSNQNKRTWKLKNITICSSHFSEMNPSFFLFKQTKVDENIVSKLKCSEERITAVCHCIYF